MKHISLLLALLLPAGAEAPTASVRLLEGETLTGRLLGIQEGRALIATQDGTRHRLPLDSLEAIEFRAVDRVHRGPALFLACGDSIPADAIRPGASGGVASVLHGRNPREIPLDQVRAVRFLPATGTDELWETLAAPPPEGRDLLFVLTEAGPLKVEATVLELAAQGLLAEVGGRRRHLPLDRLQGFVLAAGPRPAPSARLPAQALYACGASLRGTISGGDAQTLALDHPLLGPLAIPWQALARLSCSRDRILELSAAPFRSDNAVPAFDRVWPVARDRTLEGGPIVLAGTHHRTGLAFLPKRSLSFAIPPGFNRFSAVLGFAPESEGTGKARFRILADDRVLFDRMLLASDPPVPVFLDLAGAELLVLETDFGPNLHLGSQCVFASPRLLAPPERS